MPDDVRLDLRPGSVDLSAPEFILRFKSLRAFHRFREWVEAARIVGDEPGRPTRTRLSEDGGDEWYVVATGDSTVSLHHFTDGDVDLAVVLPIKCWREIGTAVMATSGEE